MQVSTVTPASSTQIRSTATSGNSEVGKFEEIYKLTDFKPVPNNIHMVWVGSQPGESQVKYLKEWAEQNKGAEVNLWVDSKHFGAYAANKHVQDALKSDYPSGELFQPSAAPKAGETFQKEKLFRGLFGQLDTAFKVGGKSTETTTFRQAVQELNKELRKDSVFAKNLGLDPEHGAMLNRGNFNTVTAQFKELMKGTDEKFLETDALILNQTLKGWRQANPEPIEKCPEDQQAKISAERKAIFDDQQKTLADIKLLFSDKSCSNIKIRDLSNSGDLPEFKNKDAYTHEIVGRGGAYPAASDIARYEILHKHGGVYADIDLACVKPLANEVHAHPDLLQVGLMKDGKNPKNETPYFANALIAAHPGGKMLEGFIDTIGKKYDAQTTQKFDGARYFERPNKSTIERTGPNALRDHVDSFISSGTDRELHCDVASLSAEFWDKEKPENQGFWSAVNTHIKFPEGLVNFETEEQQKSATKAMAT